ncbi:hypothetical protein DFH09DRAFT_1178754 [Mycena vulgaris]|nr:hypothetical protein DFH09DRAFT_1178754 [Mycena vulgaris]
MCSSRGTSARARSSSWALRASRTSSRRAGEVYSHYMPIAIIERASMPDQRVVVSTLRDVGEQRPPGLMIVGWAVVALWEAGDVEVLGEGAEADDESRGWVRTRAGESMRDCLTTGILSDPQ